MLVGFESKSNLENWVYPNNIGNQKADVRTYLWLGLFLGSHLGVLVVTRTAQTPTMRLVAERDPEQNEGSSLAVNPAEKSGNRGSKFQ